MYYIYGDHKSLQTKPFIEPPTLKQLKDNVGNPGEGAFIEIVYHRFPDDRIVMVVDEEGLIKHSQDRMDIRCRTAADDLIAGNFFVFSFNRYALSSEDELQGLNAAQVAIVQEFIQYPSRKS